MKAAFYESQLSERRVAAIKLQSPVYTSEAIAHALRRVAGLLGWAGEEGGMFANVIARGARVLVKPNWVIHENEGPWGIEPLVTHASLIRAVVEAALAAGASEVLVGDAPVQGCDFERLTNITGIDQWSQTLAASEPRFKGVRDFRRTTCRFVDGVRVASEDILPEDHFVLYDLGEESLLEPVSDDRRSFRVTCYDPRLMAKTHSKGRHQYLVSRDVIDADVVINLPKLKTHKKAGVTCALKNLVGINGNKEYLPHHRLGGSESGGDCYPGASPVKRALEFTLDRQNQTASFAAGRLWSEISNQLNRVSRLMGDRLDVEGSWSGNDTIWRTCLDLNRILLYGRADATLAEKPQRQVLHIVDAIVAGHGDGPLRPQPLPLGFILAGGNPAAVDWVGAQLLGYSPERIRIAQQAFSRFRWPLTKFTSGDVSVIGDLGMGGSDVLFEREHDIGPISYPLGWIDAVRSNRQ